MQQQSEWIKVMLEEVVRKREAAEQARREQALRRAESAGPAAAANSRKASRKPRPS